MNPLFRHPTEDEPENDKRPNYPNPQQDRPAPKKRRSLWVTLGVLGFLFLLCGGIAIVGIYQFNLGVIEKQSKNRMQFLMIGVHNHDSAQGLLVYDSESKDGTRLLSWRVGLLPYIEGDRLYNQFDQDVAWNQGKNATASNIPFKLLQHPAEDPTSTLTPYQGFSGPGGLLGPSSDAKPEALRRHYPRTLGAIQDGTASTILIVEARTAVPYAQPIDINFPGGPTPVLGYKTSSYVHVAFADGSIRKMKPDVVNDPKFINAVRCDDGVAPTLD